MSQIQMDAVDVLKWAVLGLKAGNSEAVLALIEEWLEKYEAAQEESDC